MPSATKKASLNAKISSFSKSSLLKNITNKNSLIKEHILNPNTRDNFMDFRIKDRLPQLEKFTSPLELNKPNFDLNKIVFYYASPKIKFLFLIRFVFRSLASMIIC